MKKNNALKLTSGLLGASLLSGCISVGGDDRVNTGSFTSLIDNVTGQTKGSLMTATFMDSEVANLQYQSANNSGVTNALGQFTCAAGDQVEFFVGTLSLGTSICQKVITPQTLAAPKVQEVIQTTTSASGVQTSGGAVVQTVVKPISPTDPTVIDRVRLLIALDTDSNPANGIQLPDTTVQSGITTSKVYFGMPTFDNDAQAILNGARVNGSLPSRTEAEIHFNDSLIKMRTEYPDYDETTGSNDEYDESLIGDDGRYVDDNNDRYGDDNDDRW